MEKPSITFRPIDVWPGELAASRVASQFKAGLTDTENVLRFEVGKLDGKLLVVQLAIDEMDLKVDGRPRARAAYRHPGVIVSFESRHGPLRYFTDAFDRWEHNLRAVALGLEALRKVDRYGISKRGEQYTGWRAIESGPGPGEVTAALQLLVDAAGADPASVAPGEKPTAEVVVNRLYRRAVRNHHPDVGGDPNLFRRITDAADLLRAGS